MWMPVGEEVVRRGPVEPAVETGLAATHAMMLTVAVLRDTPPPSIRLACWEVEEVVEATQGIMCLAAATVAAVGASYCS
jgi:hypothetical protein